MKEKYMCCSGVPQPASSASVAAMVKSFGSSFPYKIKVHLSTDSEHPLRNADMSGTSPNFTSFPLVWAAVQHPRHQTPKSSPTRPQNLPKPNRVAVSTLLEVAWAPDAPTPRTT